MFVLLYQSATDGKTEGLQQYRAHGSDVQYAQ